jgi:predicted acyl esterase
MPASQTNRIQKLRYLSEPLAEDVTIAGPSVLNLFASIDQDDTNWNAITQPNPILSSANLPPRLH